MIRKIIKEFNFDKSELDINAGSIEYSLGYEIGKSPEPVREIIQSVLGNDNIDFSARAGFRIFDLHEVKIGRSNFTILNMEFECGRIISRQLQKAETTALFTATIGTSIENLSKQLMNRGEMLEGFIWDAFGSEAVERVCDKLEEKLRDSVSSENFKITNRYSPGYCGWNVSEQQKLFSLLPEKFCGITLTESSLMIPIKSVSGIIGIGRDVIKTDYQCSICDIDFCIRRKDREI